jgi:uncharacterized membrane-anchored protein YitT (DUF2179 family)
MREKTMQTRTETGREFLRKVLNALGHEKFTTAILLEYVFLIGGAIIQALSMRLFLVPAQLVSGGISGIGQIVNSFTGWPIGLMVFLGNIPLFSVGLAFPGGTAICLAHGHFHCPVLVLYRRVLLDYSR